jgi:hypothetical protein
MCDLFCDLQFPIGLLHVLDLFWDDFVMIPIGLRFSFCDDLGLAPSTSAAARRLQPDVPPAAFVPRPWGCSVFGLR